MNDNEKKKAEWHCPEIISLDIKDTKGGTIPFERIEDGTYKPES